MNYQSFTNDTLTMMYEGARGALAVDDELKKLDDRFHETSVMELMICWWIPCFAIGKTRSRIMAGWRRVIDRRAPCGLFRKPLRKIGVTLLDEVEHCFVGEIAMVLGK